MTTWPIRDDGPGRRQRRRRWRDDADRGFGALTERERQVAALICDGLDRAAIASELRMAIKTVDTHRRRVLHKVGAANSVRLVRAAIRDGFSSMHD